MARVLGLLAASVLMAGTAACANDPGVVVSGVEPSTTVGAYLSLAAVDGTPHGRDR